MDGNNQNTQVNSSTISNAAANSTTPIEPKVDLSKTTLMVLVLITLIISVVGTWGVLYELNSFRATQEPASKSAVGTVQFSIISPNVRPSESKPATGLVSLNIKRGR